MKNYNMKRTYKAWAINKQGASIDVANDTTFSSIADAKRAAKAELGKGWKVSIICTEYGYCVCQFTIRKD